MSSLSELKPSGGGGGGSVDLTAFGALTAGDTVLVNSDGTVTAVSGGTLTAENYIGIASADYADGAKATIQIKGSVNEAQSSLTAGEKYYVQTNGTLSTTPDSPSVYAGKAVSSTKLIVKG